MVIEEMMVIEEILVKEDHRIGILKVEGHVRRQVNNRRIQLVKDRSIQMLVDSIKLLVETIQMLRLAVKMYGNENSWKVYFSTVFPLKYR